MTTECSCCGEVKGTVELREHSEIRVCSGCIDWLIRKRNAQSSSHGRWTVTGFEPIFVVTDIPRAADHYAKMGFAIDFHDETYAFAHRDRDLTIHLTLEGDTAPANLYVHCDDADEIANAWRIAGLEVVGPIDEDYGKREGSHVDPDGNVIRFGSPHTS
jgi:uncharacterized glyoxalase superfamily protein PhnB